MIEGASKENTEETHQLGILFVHGIGEQAKGETLLQFGDPCLLWLDRWLDKDNKQLEVDYVKTVEGIPTEASIGCKTSTDAIVFKESWWANKFSPPNVHELSWWLLLIGTWTTLSHSVRPLVIGNKSGISRYFSITFMRTIFFYIPIAVTFQLIIIIVSLMGAIPLTPWRNFFTNLLIKMAQTLGDSFVLLQSPIQKEIAIKSVLDDINNIAEQCINVIVVAHSQGAAITYYALQRVEKKLDSIKFISVGSGLNKLAGLEKLSQALEFRQNSDYPNHFKKLLYFVPAAFVLFWLPIILCYWLDDFTVWMLIILESLFSITFGVLAVNYPVEPGLQKLKCEWNDLYASSDPVSNGKANIEGVDSKDVINEKSLLSDHTKYFSNNIDFIPRLINHMKEFGNIGWIGNVKGSMNRWWEATGIEARSFRKKTAQISKWVNFIGFAAYAIYTHGGINQCLESTNETISWLWCSLFGDGQCVINRSYMLWGAFLFIVADLVIRWCDRTSERTYTNLLFSNEKILFKLGVLLFGLMVAFAPIMWIYATYLAS